MKNKTIQSLLRDKLLERPLYLILFIVCSQLIVSLSLVFLSLADTQRHGSQAFFTPEDAAVMQGQKVYYQEGCHYCHTQSIGPFHWELKRFSDLEKAGYFPSPNNNAMEYYFESPFPRGIRRIGPDLSQAAALYTEAELRSLLKNKGDSDFKKMTHQYAYLFEEKEKEKEAHKAKVRTPAAWKVRFMLEMRLPLSDVYQRSFLSQESLSSKRGELLISYLLSRGKKNIQFKGRYYRKE